MPRKGPPRRSFGNSQAIAAKHCLRATDDHFAQAITEETGAAKSGAVTSPSGSNAQQSITEFIGIIAELLDFQVLKLARQDLNLE